ncbi:hypothetical protein [Phenylobacterium conjunctum]|uniref:Uncharacterized protein n=1 Tax=Phenylobacterium conjunctum TaxID=1298959 RepID=A0ABW3SXA6_9CAUL
MFACCAFAVFLLHQLLLPLARLFGRDLGQDPSRNAAVAWAPGADSRTRRASLPFIVSFQALAVAASVLVALALVSGPLAQAAPALASPLCVFTGKTAP